MKTVLFDIDGTLCNLTHRLPHIKNGKRDYDAFHDAAHADLPIEPLCELAFNLKDLYKIVLVSGRTDRIREATEDWMEAWNVPYSELHMRKDGDYRQDFIIKEEILDQLIAAGHEIAFVVDDRPSVVAMWRKRGIICLQCDDWSERDKPSAKGKLHIMVGPSGSGKSHWLYDQGTHPNQIISSDQLRGELCGDFKDQSKNDEVFKALHAIVETRIDHGLDTYVDATNLKRADRMAIAKLSNNGPVEYIVINRPMEEKRRDGGWRNEIGFDLMAKHEQTFKSQLKDILSGDNLPNVTVRDLRAPGS